MVEPRIIPRSEHTLSRRNVDPDALKVLYRLRDLNYVAYLVGGSVRDLLLGRRPKDFDIGTDAHPYQVKKAFRNCWIIGRRFRLAHVKFGPKTIEVATFRKSLPPLEEPAPDTEPPIELNGQPLEEADRDRLIRRDNTFGTPEEDAFRRDFTINALFYDTASRTIIDYVSGLEDLRARRIRAIGDPDERFQEDPVRMLRAVVFAERLDFELDPKVVDAIRRHKAHIRLSAPARLLDEYYKILRSGSARRSFERLAALGLLEHISPELERGLSKGVTASLDALDTYRGGFDTVPGTLNNAILLGSLIAPIYRVSRARRRGTDAERNGPRPTLGTLPLARRDVDRLAQIQAVQPRLLDTEAPQRAQRAFAHRHVFGDALTWLEIHGGDPDVVAHWREVHKESRPASDEGDHVNGTWRRRRRRRRRRTRHSVPSGDE